MAGNNISNLKSTVDCEESNPLLIKSPEEQDKKSAEAVEQSPAPLQLGPHKYGWAANRLPTSHGSVVGQPMAYSMEF